MLLICYFRNITLYSALIAIVSSGWKMQKRLSKMSCYGSGKTVKDPLLNIRSSNICSKPSIIVP